MIYDVAVLDLAGLPVDGLRAQVRRRYDDPGWQPMVRTLRAVRLRQDAGNVHRGGTLPAATWIYWSWVPETTAGRFDCGFAGMTVDLARETGRSIAVEVQDLDGPLSALIAGQAGRESW